MPLVARLLASSAGVGTNGIFECKSLSKNAHRAQSAASKSCRISEKLQSQYRRSVPLSALTFGGV
jgi:hypothetical protein